MQSNYTRNDWLNLHNRAAPEYINSEWSREVFFGVAGKRKALFSHASGSVLDVGCGYGMNFRYLMHADRITGVDFSPVMLAKARLALRARATPVDVREGDAESLDFPDSTFDTVISALSTCSFFKPVAALQEMRRVCKPEGRILLIEHGRGNWELIGRYQDRHLQEQIETGGCRWNQEPQELVKQAGLEILEAHRSLFGIFHLITVSPAKDGSRHERLAKGMPS